MKMRNLLVGVVLCGAAASGALAAQGPVNVRLATPFVENDRSVRLEAVVFVPEGQPPFPTIVFNHGSTGRGDDPRRFGQTWAPAELARFFTERGWMVAFPQRRGRGGSDGAYDEGFLPDRSRYACDPRLSQPGFDRALQDIDAAIDALLSRGDVDARRIVVAGVSRGGILSIAYAGQHPSRVVGAINFVGGWMSERCEFADELNGGNFVRGASFRGPTLWLYGDHDPFYSVGHSRRNFQRFVNAGGRGTFHAFDVGTNGHLLSRFTSTWETVVDAFLKATPQAAQRISISPDRHAAARPRAIR